MDEATPTGLTFAGSLEAQTKLTTELALARLEFGEIEKDRVGQYGNQKFKYVTLGALTAATLPALAKHGVAFLQSFNDSPTPGKQRITTILCGHGASITTSLEFDPRLSAKEGYGEAIKEYGKLRTYLRRYELQTLLALDAEPDADEAGLPSQEPQKRREAPKPPEVKAETKPAPQRQETLRPAPVQQEGSFKAGQLQVVPQPTKDPLLEKLTTVAPETRVTPPEPVVVREDADPPASEALQNELLNVYRTAGMTRISFGQLCLDTVGVPANEVRNSTANMTKVLEALKAKTAGAA